MADPKFVHDCDKCIHLGGDDLHDFYWCHRGGRWPTVIARYGSNGPNYASGLEVAVMVEERGESDHPLVKALVLARGRNLVPDSSAGHPHKKRTLKVSIESR